MQLKITQTAQTALSTCTSKGPNLANRFRSHRELKTQTPDPVMSVSKQTRIGQFHCFSNFFFLNFKSNGGFCVYYLSNVFCNTQDLKIGEYHSDTPQFLLGQIQSRDGFRRIACEWNIWWIISFDRPYSIPSLKFISVNIWEQKLNEK